MTVFRHLCVRLTALPLALFLPHSADATAVQQTDSVFVQTVRSQLDAARLPWTRWPVITDVQTEVRRAYDAQAWKPLWMTDRLPTPAALAMLSELRHADRNGLERDDYDVDSLSARVPRVRFAPDDSLQVRRAEWDLALSVAATRYVLALQRGRVNPRKLFALLRFDRDSTDGANHLLALRTTLRPNDYVNQLQPPFAAYRLLQASLPRLQSMARDTALGMLPSLPRRLRPGMRWEGMPLLRRRLAAMGDLPSDSLVPRDTILVYDRTAAAAVKAYQRRQGFTDDGVIGDSTGARLRRPITDEIRQVSLTLERWRWLPKRFATPPIIVNLAAFRLYGFQGTSDAEDSLLTMNVVVGSSIDHSTPLLADTMTSVVFRPYWDVPRSIMLNEIRPKALQQPGWFSKEKYELVQDGTILAPTPENLASIASNGVRVRQKPGLSNALGDMKFLLPNEEDIYLHDTPSRTLFSRARRDFSHGCVRLADPLALAKLVLRDRPEWTEERMLEAIAKDVPTTVRLKTPVPVYLFYGTAVARSDGAVQFFADLYGHDGTLDATLRRGYPY